MCLCTDVDRTLGWMQRVIDFYQVGEDVEDKVREGPGSGIQQYLSVLQEVRIAMDHFHQFNPDSIELEHLHELFISGREALIREFLQLLKKHSKPVPLATLHDMVQEESEGERVTGTLANIITGCGGVCSYSLGCGGVCSYSLGCGGVCSYSLGCGGVCSYSLGCGGVCSYSLGCGGVCSYSLEWVGLGWVGVVSVVGSGGILLCN